MDYKKLSKEDFDALVTGEITQMAIWLEDSISNIITTYFVKEDKVTEFKTLALDREGFSFQNKIDMLRALLRQKFKKAEFKALNNTLVNVEEFKKWRNAMAHGLDVSEENPKKLEIQIQTMPRSGKENVFTITPESHDQKMEEANSLLEELKDISKALNIS